MSIQYQRLLKILEKWPVDKAKAGRDLGEQLRKHLQDISNHTKLTTVESNKLEKEIDSIERLANNFYGTKFKRIGKSTATGLTAEQCSQVLTSEFLQYLNTK